MMSTSDDSSSDLAASKLAVEEERDWEDWDKDQRKSSGKSQKRTWPPSDSEIAVDEDKGWEDWDEDQRRALGKSHQRTLGSLEEGTPRSPSISSVRSGLSVPTAEDPKGQILPSDQTLSRQEQESKKRRHLKDDPLKPAKKFCTRTCVAISVVGVMCLIGAIVINFIVPYKTLKTFILPIDEETNPTQVFTHSPSETILPVQLPDRYVEQIQAPASSTAVMIENPTVDSLIQNQAPEASVTTGQASSANTIVQVETIPPLDIKVHEADKDEELSFVSSFWRSVTTYIGIESKLAERPKNKVSELTVPENVANDLAGILVPEYENLYSLTAEPVVDTQPVLWLTQRSTFGTLKEILTFCFGLVLACDAAISHEEASTLEIFSTSDNSGHFVNVNTETKEGLIRAQNIGIVESDLVHVIATPFLADASFLFSRKTRTGRVFVLLRHPVDQAYSDFLYRQNLSIEHPDYIPSALTLGQFVESERLYTNPLTRALVNVTEDTLLSEGHTYLAKKILKERVLVGLVESFHESIHRFEIYFGWNLRDTVCVPNFEAARDQKQDHEQLLQSSQEWKALSDRNYADIELYEFGKALFESQSDLTSINS